MGYLYQLWDLDKDPDSSTLPYTPYSFVPVGSVGPINMSMIRDFARRESVMVLPSADSVLDGRGRQAGRMARRDQSFTYRVFTHGDNDAAYDANSSLVAPGIPKRLVYKTDQGTLWFNVGHNGEIKQTETSAGNWGSNGFVDVTVNWRIRPAWRARFPEAAPITFSPANNEVFSPLNNEVFLVPGSTLIAVDPQTFNMDATGVAGNNLPTVPDTGIIFDVWGPVGGSLGFTIYNLSVNVYDRTGSPAVMYIYIPFPLLDATDTIHMDCGAQIFLHNGTRFRPLKEKYQDEWYRVDNGIINVGSVKGQGTGIRTGGVIARNWWRLRA